MLTPTNTANDISTITNLTFSTTDVDGDYLRYKIKICTEVSMAQDCQTFDQTLSQTGFSGQNADSGNAYSSGTTATYTIQSALLANKTYFWQVLAIDPAGSNGWSLTPTPFSYTTKSAAIAPAPCSTVKAFNNSSITVKWTDNATNEDFYQVWKVTDGGLPAQLGSNLAPNTIQLIDSSVVPSHSYAYLIRALRTDGLATIYSSWCSTSTTHLPATNNSLLVN